MSFSDRTYSATDAKAVTPSDTTRITPVAVALWVGVEGDVSVETAKGTTVLFKGVQGLLSVQCTRVRSTGTTATDIVALFN